MKINGHEIAEQIYKNLRDRVGDLQKNGITPQLVVLLVGNNPGSIAYVNQKEISGAKVGAKVTIKRFVDTVTTEELVEEIERLNGDQTVHGILIQRPLPSQIDVNKLERLTNPQKDIDGFHPDSPYTLPLPLAIIRILEEIYYFSSERRESRSPVSSRLRSNNKFLEWLNSQSIVLLGKGETGGQPIIHYLQKLSINPIVIDSKTPNPESILKQADILISAVGKRDIIQAKNLKKGVILLGVGMTQGEGRKLHGDYQAQDVEAVASYYTPTPHGVGPVNVAMLLDNLITAAEKQTQQ
ncbi:MAG: bifunctional 5,10-methylenetetrahydrofolate dehydrogenase/5,10-methenyltetrahydrofolate cyclohydrolase [Candidatus Levybacteria bacterium]|nr:bifunctional 5,10-methylenetetrahydrofolate dehydrogenase/5,10-methenyltetrahydrofolate cyclohydrolase [Candidatus Levybacteria bacterium]